MTVRETFDSAALTYDLSRRALIPDYKNFYGTVLEALPEDRKRAYRILDLGAGTGTLSEMVGKFYPHASVVVSDFAQSMLDRAKEKLGKDRRFSFLPLDMLLDAYPGELDAIVSSLAIHHLEHSDKRLVFSKAFRALKPGGVFVNADQTSSGDEARDQRWFDDWLTAVRAGGANGKELDCALERMRLHDQNAPERLQLRWLEEAGFREVDLRYRKYFFAVFRAVK